MFENFIIQQLEKFNSKRHQSFFTPLTIGKVANLVIYDREMDFKAKTLLFNFYIKGFEEMPTRYIRMLAKLFRCSIGTLLPKSLNKDLPRITIPKNWD